MQLFFNIAAKTQPPHTRNIVADLSYKNIFEHSKIKVTANSKLVIQHKNETLCFIYFYNITI